MIGRILARTAIAAALLAPSIQASADEAPAIPSGAAALTQEEILSLLDGKSFSFTGYDEPIVGTTTWDAAKKTVSGTYVWDGTQEGTYEAEWFIENGRNCTRSEGKEPVCQSIYRYEAGFMEVNAAGAVHAVSVPRD